MADYQGVNSVINLGLPQVAPEAFTDPQVKAAVEMFLQGQYQLLQALEQYSGITQKDMTLWNSLQPSDTLLKQNSGRFYCLAGTILTFGQLVQLYDDGGVCKARLADATAAVARRAHGYCNVAGGVALGEYGEVILTQGLLGVTGVVSGQDLYLSTTPGSISTTPATGAGELEQYIGFGVADDIAFINIASGTFIQH